MARQRHRGHLVAASGAIPVYRPREHGEKAQEYNEAMYRDAFASLHRGECLAIAPEGVSRFAPNMAKPFKTGPARIVLQAVEAMRTANPDFTVHIVPVGLTYTHREKFRSDVCVDVGEPIVVSVRDLAPSDVTDPEARSAFMRDRARVITDKMADALTSVSVDSPDFETSRLAMTDTRIFLPLGTRITLKEHVAVLREWVRMLSPPPPPASPTTPPTEMDAKLKELRGALHEYQAMLDAKGVKDERVRRYAFGGDRPAPSRAPKWMLVGFRAVSCALLWTLAAPGLVVWGPVWLAIKYREPKVLAKGRGWVDSVAEMKLITGFLGCLVLGVLSGRYAPLTYAGLWLTLRAYEEAVASTRSLYTHFKFLYLYPSTLAGMLAARRKALDLLHAFSDERMDRKRVPESVLRLEADERQGKMSVIRVWPWENWSLFRRRKKDWNELLRVQDFNTADYF